MGLLSPTLEKEDDRFLGQDPCYKDLKEYEITLGECLKDTVNRFLPYWYNDVEPFLRQGKHILIFAHGNSLRALVKYLDNVTDQDIVNLNIPTGIPLIYELDESFKSLKSYYLVDEQTLKKATESVVSQGKEFK